MHRQQYYTLHERHTAYSTYAGADAIVSFCDLSMFILFCCSFVRSFVRSMLLFLFCRLQVFHLCFRINYSKIMRIHSFSFVWHYFFSSSSTSSSYFLLLYLFCNSLFLLLCVLHRTMRPVHAYTLHAIFAFSTQPIADEIYGIFDCACVANTVLSYIWPAVEHHSLCDVAFLHTVLFFSLHSFINGNWFFIHVGIFYICCCSLATAAPLRFNCSVWRNGREWKRRAAPSDVLRLMRSVTCRWQRTRIRNRIKCTHACRKKYSRIEL